IQPCIPLWGGAPSEWVSVKNLSYSTDVEKETLQDLQKQGMKFYLVSDKKDWDLLRQAENLSENEAEIFMQKLCKEGKAVLFDNKNANLNEWNIAFDGNANPTSQELAERRWESDQRKQKFAAMKAHILNPESKTRENEKETINPFIKNYIEQLRSK
ncbi:MAG: hypothetical protein IKO06_06480, partial [Alphaproteobacteria bacterium]|nr:hypothetical protein [Alphaproteobacteria bacterium]